MHTHTEHTTPLSAKGATKGTSLDERKPSHQARADSSHILSYTKQSRRDVIWDYTVSRGLELLIKAQFQVWKLILLLYRGNSTNATGGSHFGLIQ